MIAKYLNSQDFMIKLTLEIGLRKRQQQQLRLPIRGKFPSAQDVHGIEAMYTTSKLHAKKKVANSSL